FLSLCLEQAVEPNAPINTLDILFADKTALRLNEICTARHITLEDQWQFAGQDVALAQILHDSQKHLPDSKPLLGVLHGDFCCSNILYDF
ncbi:capsular biosynthesis protein, partial [Vibrio cholerae]|nr:capsular biosynthesis protein [Vibrio cholerae]